MVGIVVLWFSYFPYAAAFVSDESGQPPVIDVGLVAIAILVAPLVFVAVGLISRNRDLRRRVLISMGFLVGLGLVLGLLSPVLGATAGFGVGIALTLDLPRVTGQLRRRLVAVTFAVAYTFVLLLYLTPAGVFSGAVLPALMIGFADEYGVWRSGARRTGAD